MWPRTAQWLMRHSNIDLTVKTYTDPRVLDLAKAIESLPALPAMIGREVRVSEAERLRANGTDEATASRHMGQHVGNSCSCKHQRSSDGIHERRRCGDPPDDGIDVSGAPDRSKEPRSSPDSDSEPTTPNGTRTRVFRMRT